MAAFLDTNILLYALSAANKSEAAKVATARKLLNELIEVSDLCLSTQVLSEFVSNATRKGNPPLTLQEAAEVVNDLSSERVLPVDTTLVKLAVERVRTSRISYWDALIVEAAIQSGATILYTEDMHHGMRYETLELRNPFLP